MRILLSVNATETPTVPNARDQAAPLARPVSLSELALAQGVTPEFVGRYLASCAVPSFRIVAACVELQAVSL
jgi:hypothetical protein